MNVTRCFLKKSAFFTGSTVLKSFLLPRLCSSAILKQSLDTKNKKNIQSIEDEILRHSDYFKVSQLFTVEDLFKSRIHFGHREGTLNGYMLPYIFGSRLSHLVIDLDQTAELLTAALNFTAHIAFREGIILFVCRNPAYQVLVEQIAMECEEYAHTREIKEGIFTNADSVFGCPIRLPDLIIALNTLETTVKQSVVIKECAKMRVPVVGVVDTNCDPRLITYPVPGNDDSYASISLLGNLFKKAILLGKAKRKELENIV